MLLDFHEHFIKQKFQETQTFHVGKGKCLVRATEPEMSVWSMEMSADQIKMTYPPTMHP